MSLHNAAKYLESHGRGNDTMLVHMTPREVKGLQELAMASGGSLSINPHTGLVEAGWLSKLLPTIAGIGLSFIPGVGPLAAAGLVGGAETLRTGDLGKGLLAGLGAYGGAGMMQGLSQAGAQALGTTGTQASAVPGVDKIGTEAGAAVRNFTPIPGANEAVPNAAAETLKASSGQAPVNFTNVKAGFGDVGRAWDLAPKGTGWGLGATAMNAASPEMKPPAQEEEDPRYKKAPYSMFLSPNYKSINPVATPNYYRPTGYAQGGIAAMAPGGIAGTEPNMYPQSQMDKTQYATPTQMPTSAEVIAADYEPKVNPYTGEPQQMAMASGGIASYNGKDGSEVEDEDRFNVETPDRERKTRFTVMPHMIDLDRKLMAGRVGADIPIGKDTLSAGLSGIAGNMGGHLGAKPMAVDVGYNTKVGPGYLNAQIARDLANRQNRYQANYNIPFAEGGQLGSYSDGGRMLKGPGDGMSDSIPASISGKQPARLADGEFVVPADVVSHLGNGSTDAGAKRLYAMMDKVRQARTGKKKQAKAIKADKYMPA